MSEPRAFEIPEPAAADPVTSIAFDPKGRYMFVAANQDRASVVPLDGSPPRQLERFSEDTLLHAAAVSPSGRLVATAFFYGSGSKTLRVWDLESNHLRLFDLPPSQSTTTGYESGIAKLAFLDESTLYTMGDGGLRRWDLSTGSHETVVAASPGYAVKGSILPEKGVALTIENRRSDKACREVLLHDLTMKTSRKLTSFGDCGTWNGGAFALDPSGAVAATGTLDGVIRVGQLSGGEPHLLVGHKGAVDRIAISPDLRWLASTGEDSTLRLWPLPDLSKPPLHTLPHDELLAKLRSLTNFRAVRDPSSASGWKVEVGPFPGWKDVPAW
jgi:WD40 repeat protein